MMRRKSANTRRPTGTIEKHITSQRRRGVLMDRPPGSWADPRSIPPPPESDFGERVDLPERQNLLPACQHDIVHGQKPVAFANLAEPLSLRKIAAGCAVAQQSRSRQILLRVSLRTNSLTLTLRSLVLIASCARGSQTVNAGSVDKSGRPSNPVLSKGTLEHSATSILMSLRSKVTSKRKKPPAMP